MKQVIIQIEHLGQDHLRIKLYDAASRSPLPAETEIAARFMPLFEKWLENLRSEFEVDGVRMDLVVQKSEGVQCLTKK